MEYYFIMTPFFAFAEWYMDDKLHRYFKYRQRGKEENNMLHKNQAPIRAVWFLTLCFAAATNLQSYTEMAQYAIVASFLLSNLFLFWLVFDMVMHTQTLMKPIYYMGTTDGVTKYFKWMTPIGFLIFRIVGLVLSTYWYFNII